MTTKQSETSPAAVDDRELMRLLDDELDDDMASDVEARLADDEEALAKLAGLELVGSVLRDLVDDDERGDGIADAVMERIDEADSSGDAPEEAQPQPLPRVELGSVPEPVNDNSRRIYAIAAAAAAVAAGLMFYSRTEPEPVAQAPVPMVAQPTAEVPAAAPAPSEAEVASAGDEEPEVEIAAVDFGSQSGSVFYISGGKNTAAGTAVLWVTDPGE